MNTLWPLVQQELARLMPSLREWAQRLGRGHDGEAAAQWLRRLDALRGAARVLHQPGFDRLLQWLLGAWNDPSDRAARAADVQAALALLDALLGADADQLGERLAALDHEIARFGDRRAEATRKAEQGVDARLRGLFAAEIEDKTTAMSRLLLRLEQQPDQTELIVPLMRAAHSIKGAARAVRNDTAVALAHALEDRLSAVQKRGQAVDSATVELALRGIDLLRALGRGDAEDAGQAAAALRSELAREPAAPPPAEPIDAGGSTRRSAEAEVEEVDPILRVRASHVGRLIALAGTGLVESRRLRPFADRQQRMRRAVIELSRLIDALHQALGAPTARNAVGAELAEVRQQLADLRHQIGEWVDDFGEYMRESFDLNERLYHTASMTRLRPLGDIVGGYPRMVRDLARELGKRVRLDVHGEHVPVDRDVLERLDAPLTHLLRNAVDHGIEVPALRCAAGKPEDGVISISAMHRAGMLAIELRDDGRGIDYERVRERLVASGRAAPEEAAGLPREALDEALFAPGLSTREEVSEISGRGVGLDVVRQLVKQLGGSVRMQSEPGRGTRFALQVPISRAVTRALVVKLGGERYAFPLLRVERVLRIGLDAVTSHEGLQYLPLEGRNIGLVPLAEHLGLGASSLVADRLDVVVVADEGRVVGFVVEAILGEYDLATRALDARLGRVADLAALAVLPDGAPVVLLDADDLLRGALERERARLRAGLAVESVAARRRRILVVDDSISVRELERQLLGARGYEVEVAVDGADAWERLRESSFDLVVTDVDMPRLDGIELARSIKQDPKLRRLPVIIVSYRDRPEDRARGREVHADAYITKGDFHEDGFVRIVRNLVGEAEEGG
jgi:two-component system sensor histidine kinase and response regulator WspE